MKISTPQIHKLNASAIVTVVLVFVTLLLMLPYFLTQQSTQNRTDLSAEYFVDKTFTLPLNDAIELKDEAWQPLDNYNFGLVSEPHWLKFTILPSAQDEERLLLINYGLLDHVDVWFIAGTQGADDDRAEQTNDVLSAYRSGDAFEFENRSIQVEPFLFPVPQHEAEITVFVRASSKGPIKVPIELWEEAEFIEYSGLHKLFLGLFFGFMIAMALSNLFIYASTRNTLFAIYTGYVTSIAFVVAGLHGIGFHYVWPNNIWLQEFAIPIFACTTMIFIISLTIRLLSLKKVSPVNYRLLRNVRYIFLLLLVLCLFMPYQVVIKTVLVLLVITTPIILVSGIVLAFNGSIVARYFCGAWAALLVSGVSIAMENFGVFQSPIDSSYLLMVGAVIEATLLALALAVSFSEQLYKASKARRIAIENEEKALIARDELIALQEKNQADLEYSIEERTLELEIALRELSEKNLELEKLSAVDPLTGLMNRRFFDKRLLAETRRSKRELTPLGIAMLDIDHFKKINDTYGHLCGDHCLKVFAQTLKEEVKRPSDVLCRYGGEEFVLILPNTDEAGLEKLLERFRSTIENKKIVFEGIPISMTVSIGGCSRIIATEDEHTLLLGFVDKQLYEAKESGRNRVKISTY